MSSVTTAYVPDTEVMNGYMVMDDLLVLLFRCLMPILNLVKKFNIKNIKALKDAGALEEKVVHIGMAEVIEFYCF